MSDKLSEKSDTKSEELSLDRFWHREFKTRLTAVKYVNKAFSGKLSPELFREEVNKMYEFLNGNKYE